MLGLTESFEKLHPCAAHMHTNTHVCRYLATTFLVFKFTQYKNADKKKIKSKCPMDNFQSATVRCVHRYFYFTPRHEIAALYAVDAAFPYTLKMDFYIVTQKS